MKREPVARWAVRISWSLLAGLWGGWLGAAAALRLPPNADSFGTLLAQGYFGFLAEIGLVAGLAFGALVGGLAENTAAAGYGACRRSRRGNGAQRAGLLADGRGDSGELSRPGSCDWPTPLVVDPSACNCPAFRGQPLRASARGEFAATPVVGSGVPLIRDY